jgi:hypothetical protein
MITDDLMAERIALESGGEMILGVRQRPPADQTIVGRDAGE